METLVNKVQTTYWFAAIETIPGIIVKAPEGQVVVTAKLYNKHKRTIMTAIYKLYLFI